MNELNYNKIMELITPLLPIGWKKVVLFNQIEENSYEIFFYVQINNKYVNCYDLEKTYNITRKELRSVFSKIFKLLRPFQSKDKWSTCTFSVSSSGKFNMDYNFDEIPETILEYKEKWLKKYLKS
jgi:hypothetical protein